MKKIIAISFISLFMTSLTSCFLFQKHETCPAYSMQNDEIIKTIDTDVVLEIENNDV